NQKSRFLHSWIPLLWVGAGVGAAALIPVRRGRIATWLGYAGAALAHAGGLVAAAHAPEGGIRPGSRSTLDITDAYLPDLAESRHAAVFSNLPLKQLAQWTYMDRYRRMQRLETDVRGFDPAAADNRRVLDTWVSTTDCDAIVYLDFPPGTTFYQKPPGCENLPQYREMMDQQHRFAISRVQE